MGKWFALAFFAACSTNAPAADPALEAQTTFAHDVYPILVNQCTSNTGGCHSNANPLLLTGNEAEVYRSVLLYAGDFTTNAPLLHAHSFNIDLNADALAEFELWFEQERAARGL